MVSASVSVIGNMSHRLNPVVVEFTYTLYVCVYIDPTRAEKKIDRLNLVSPVKKRTREKSNRIKERIREKMSLYL